jgi:phosphatidate cytidylyltransferase
MKQRIITALCGIPLLLAFIWFDTPWFPLLILLVASIATLGALEFYRLAALSEGRPLTIFGIVWTLLFIVGAHFEITYEATYIAPSLLTLAVALPFIWLSFRPKERDFVSWGWTLAGILYMGWMLSHYVSLRELDQGKGWVIFTIFSTFACDTAALFVGRAWGKHHLAPTISPGKTWEGAVGGFVATLATAVALRAILGLFDLLPSSLSYAQTIILGALIGIFAQLGDLLESLLKRRAGVKDSGNLLPGHGGILDRIDSVIFTGVVVYYYAMYIA